MNTRTRQLMTWLLPVFLGGGIPAENFFQNGDFEEGNHEWIRPWHSEADVAYPKIGDGSQDRRGRRVLQFAMKRGERFHVRYPHLLWPFDDRLPLPEGWQNCILAFWVRSDRTWTSREQVTFKVTFCNGKRKLATEISVRPGTAPLSWQLCTGKVSVPPGYREVYFELLSSVCETDAVVQVDNLFFGPATSGTTSSTSGAMPCSSPDQSPRPTCQAMP